jgi:hypothetical protein
VVAFQSHFKAFEAICGGNIAPFEVDFASATLRRRSKCLAF